MLQQCVDRLLLCCAERGLVRLHKLCILLSVKSSYLHRALRRLRGTLHKTGLYFICIYTLICYFTYLNSPVFYGPTPIVPEGAEHRLGGLHPGAPSLASLPAAARASPPAYCACRHWASRTRAVSLLTGGLIPQLALYLIKRNPPKRSIVTTSLGLDRC